MNSDAESMLTQVASLSTIRQFTSKRTLTLRYAYEDSVQFHCTATDTRGVASSCESVREHIESIENAANLAPHHTHEQRMWVLV